MPRIFIFLNNFHTLLVEIRKINFEFIDREEDYITDLLTFSNSGVRVKVISHINQ